MSVEVLSSNEVIADLSYAPASEESSSVAMDYIVTQILNKYRWLTPAIVKEYDREKNVVTIQPAIKESTTDESIEICELEVPCVVIGGGGWVTSYPLKEGNTGWLLTNDRDISLFLYSKEVSEANTYRRHDFADSIFLPDIISDFVHNKDEDGNATVFQNINGDIKAAIDEESLRIKYLDTTKVTIDQQAIKLETEQANIIINQDGVSITANNDVKAHAERITLTGAVTVEGTLHVTDNANFDSNVAVSGNENVSGNVAANGDVTAGAISLTRHVHGGVEAGAGTTGVPQ